MLLVVFRNISSMLARSKVILEEQAVPGMCLAGAQQVPAWCLAGEWHVHDTCVASAG